MTSALDKVKEGLGQLICEEGYLFVYQSFPKLDGDFVGSSVIASPDDLMEHFRFLDPVYSLVLERYRNPDDGPTFVGIFQKK